MSFKEFVAYILGFIKPLTVLIMALSMLVFLWGVVRFIFASDDPKKITEGRTAMMWGIVGLFVMVSLWGLVAFVKNTLKPVIKSESTNINVESLFRVK